MNMKKIMISFLCPLLLFVGCASDPVSDEPYSDITEEITESIEDTDITSMETAEQLSDTDITEEVTEPVRDIKFTSMEEAEQISDSDLIYIIKQGGNAAYTDIEEFDLFGVELAANPDSKHPFESFHMLLYPTTKSAEEIDTLSCITSEERRKNIDKTNQNFVESTRTQEPGEKTGSVPEDVEYIFCGENDWYIEYSIRYTDVRTWYSYSNHNVLKTERIPRAYRYVYMKTMIESVEDKWLLLGELDADYVQQQLDLFIWARNANIYGEHILYREVIETEDKYVYSYLHTSHGSADWDVNATATVERDAWTVDKQTHEIQSTLLWMTEPIKKVEIEGTALSWD